MIDVQANPYDDQSKLWNGLAGQAWVDEQQLLDRIFQPLGDRLVEAVAAAAPARVLDVGCGCGSTTLSVALLLGSSGEAVGVDISAPMIDFARARALEEALPAKFVCADAETHDLGSARFDMIISRLGVMFFADPIAAFGNLRRASRPGARLELIAWRGAAENPFMTTAERAVAHLLPDMPARRPGAPGQFAFGDRDHVQNLLEAGGWRNIDIEPIDMTCAMPEAELATYVSKLGPVGLVLHGADEATRRRAVETARAAFEPYVTGGEVTFNAACWAIRADR